MMAFLPTVLFLGLGACLSSGGPLPLMAEEINQTLSPEHVALQAGDLLEVRFAEEMEWNHQTEVRQNGMASFYLLDEVAVAGMSLEQLDVLLEERYTSHLVDPKLTIAVIAAAPRHVTVMGEVQKPGEIEISGKRISFLEALGKAGGPRLDSASPNATLLIRWMPETQTQQVWKIDAHWDHWGQGPPLLLQPYDIIFVPNKPIVDANIWVDRYIRKMIPIPSFGGLM